MRKSTFISAMLILLTVNAVMAQSQVRQKKAARQTAEPTEEEVEKSYQQWEARERAVRRSEQLSDPQQRIKALERLRRDFPLDQEVPGIIDDGMLDTYIKFWPQQTKKILALINKIVNRPRTDGMPVSRSPAYDHVAAKLVDAGILLDRAEEFAARSVATFDEQEVIKRLKKRDQMLALAVSKNKDSAAMLRTQPLSPEELVHKARAERAKRLTTLGRVKLKRGRTAEAEKILKEALDANPTISEANISLAEIALSAGDHAAAVEYLSTVAIRTPLQPELRQQLETSYRKLHGGSMAGLEEMLDAKYRVLMPNPIKVEPYQPTRTRTDRVVLAEMFTGAGCGPCVGADLAFEAAMERYTNRNLLVLMYHLHRPLPDPMVNPSSLARAAFYDAQRTPTLMIDGEKDTKGGAIREKSRVVYDRIKPLIDKRLETAAEASIEVDAVLEGALVRVSAAVSKIETRSKGLKLQIALVENELRYSGENLVRIHPMVVRSLAATGGGFSIDSSRPNRVEYTFDLAQISAAIKAYLDDYELHGDYGPVAFKEKKDTINGHNLSVVAFVQDEQSGRVLQAAGVAVRSAGAGEGKK